MLAVSTTSTTDDGATGYLRPAWIDGGWMRILPYEAMQLEVAITTADQHGHHGGIDDILRMESLLPYGQSTRLTWSSDDNDVETQWKRDKSQEYLKQGLANIGYQMPTTVGELADLLDKLDVYEHTSFDDGSQRWHAPLDIPRVSDALPMPNEWHEAERSTKWTTVTSGPAFMILEHMEQRGRPDRYWTTVSQLANQCRSDPATIRAGIEGMNFRFDVTVERHDATVPIDWLAYLPDHARFSLLLDWSKIDLEDHGGDADVSNFMFPDAPWREYFRCRDLGLDETTLQVLGCVPFSLVRPPGGHARPASLIQFAEGSGVSLEGAASSLIELEKSGYAWWVQDTQTLVVSF